MRPIRNSVKALILMEGRLLVIKKTEDDGLYYLLPGGGQEPGEDFITTLRRECREEIGAEIEIEDLRYVREYIGRNHEFSTADAEVHQIEFMFTCTLKGDTVVGLGSAPDQDQIGVEWLPLATLSQEPFYPRSLGVILSGCNLESQVIYLGDMN